MATRFYLPTASPAAVSPAYHAGWNDTTNAGSRQQLVTTRTNSAFATITSTETLGSAALNLNLLSRQYVSDPIVGDQTIAGTLKGQLRMAESGAPATFIPQIRVRVLSNDGSTVRGTLFAGDTRTTSADEIPTTLTNTRIPPVGISPVTLSSVSALDGDRVVLEFGVRAANSTSTNYALTCRYGDSGASDLTEGGTETTDLNPWVEFSADINFIASMVEGVGMVPI